MTSILVISTCCLAFTLGSSGLSLYHQFTIRPFYWENFRAHPFSRKSRSYLLKTLHTSLALIELCLSAVLLVFRSNSNLYEDQVNHYETIFIVAIFYTVSIIVADNSINASTPETILVKANLERWITDGDFFRNTNYGR